MERLTDKLAKQLEKEAEEDFSNMVSQQWITKNKAARVLMYHEKSIRNLVKQGALDGYRDKDGYHVRTVSVAAFRYKKMFNLSRDIRFRTVHEILSAHQLIRK